MGICLGYEMIIKAVSNYAEGLLTHAEGEKNVARPLEFLKDLN